MSNSEKLDRWPIKQETTLSYKKILFDREYLEQQLNEAFIFDRIEIKETKTRYVIKLFPKQNQINA